MEVLTAATPVKKTKTIPEELIYEIDEGTPIYYRGYRDVLSGKLKTDDIMGSSRKQSFIITQLIFWLRPTLETFFHFFTSELGIKFQKSQRAADIALVLKPRMSFEDIWSNEYMTIIPDIIIEVDIKADVTEMPDPTNYFFRKTQQLLNNGATKVIWIFTASETVMVAESGKAIWEIKSWTQDVEVSHGCTFNIAQIIATFQGK